MKKSLLLFLLGSFGLSGCMRLANEQYDYAYVNSMGAYVTRAELPGDLYVLTIGSDSASLEKVDAAIDPTVLKNGYESIGQASITSSRVIGASADLIDVSLFSTDVVGSGSLEFEAKIDTDSGETKRVRDTNLATMVEDLYRAIVARDGVVPGQEPLQARKVIENDNVYYAVVSGVGSAKKLELSLAPPQGSQNGINLTIGEQKFSNLKVRNNKKWTCQASSPNANCSVAITVLDADWRRRGGQTTVDVKPTTGVQTESVSTAFRNRQ